MKHAGGPAAFFGQRHKILDMIENAAFSDCDAVWLLPRQGSVTAGLSFGSLPKRGSD